MIFLTSLTDDDLFSGYNATVRQINRYLSPNGPFHLPVSIYEGAAHEKAPDTPEKLQTDAMSTDDWKELFDFHGLLARRQGRGSIADLKAEFKFYWKQFAGILDHEWIDDTEGPEEGNNGVEAEEEEDEEEQEE
ncbi:hypothetical protein ABW21_db0204207 [Orbilia brochopaga]|nr:hypothetical protein ABW21_db0204207 [Drechslerella brochopaga]